MKRFKEVCFGEDVFDLGRKVKRTVGHNMPRVVRNTMMAAVATGKMMGADDQADKDRYRKFRSSLMTKRSLPKFEDS